MNKAIEVCIRYEKARAEIVRLTRKIGDAAEVKCENHSDNGGFFDAGQECIERLWEWNKQTSIAEQEEGCIYGPGEPGVDYEIAEYPDGDQPKLCPRCAQVDRLIQQRKKAKQEWGIAKRAVSAVGKAAANKQIN